VVYVETLWKQKRFKTCPRCRTRNGYKSKFCRECNSSLRNAKVIREGDFQIVTKRKTLRNKFTKYVVDWLKKFDKLSNNSEGWLFPALRVIFTTAYFDFKSHNHMTIQNFDRILKRLDNKMTSCLFRYGGVEKYLVLGYNPHELKEIGDWSSSKMPEVYAERKGLTPALRKWSEDTR
jgi:hypothetical protein